MDIKYINKINENFTSYLFSGVKSRANTFGGKYFYHFVRLNYFIKGIASYFFFTKKRKLEFYNNPEIIIIGSHFIDEYIEFEKNKKIILIGSISEFKLAYINKYNFYDASKVYRLIAFMNWKKTDISTRLQQELHTLEVYLEKHKSTLRKVYVNADLLPFYRAILSIFVDSDIKIICPQHGLYTTELQYGEIEGGLADINYVYDLYQKEILMNCGISSKSIIVNNLKKSNRQLQLELNTQNQDKIVIVSEGWHVNLGPNVIKYYFTVYKLFKVIKRNKKIPIIRLHPSEKYLKYLLFFLKLDLSSFEDSVCKYNLYVGYSSSFLKEVKDVGKISIQLKQNFYNNIIDMQKVGYSNYTMTLSEFDRFLYLNSHINEN